MSELEQNTAVEEAVKEPQVSQDEKKTEQAVPYYRFQELVKERNDLKSQVQKVATAQEEQRKKTLEEQGEYKALLIEEQNKNKDLETKFNEVNESFSNYVNQEKESLLSKIPETKREKFTKVDDLSLLRDIVSEFDAKAGVNVGQVENKVQVSKFKGNPFTDMESKGERRKSHGDLLSHYLKKK